MSEDSMHRTLDAAMVRTAAPAERFAAVLGLHWPALLDGGCRCGWRWDHVKPGTRLGPRLIEAYNAHVAAALAAVADDGLAGRVTGRELHCDDCQQPYGVWFADNAVWNLVMGGPEAKGDPGGMLCPRCFTVRAEVVYQRTAIWRLTLNNAPAPSADRDERDGA